MGNALAELTIRVNEFQNDLRLLELAYELRPRVSDVIDFGRNGEVLELARQFVSLRDNRPSDVYGPMLVRVVATFERYLRSLAQETVEVWAARCKAPQDLPDGLLDRNIVLSGRLLASKSSPRDHLAPDYVALVRNLGTCVPGSTPFRLNSDAFASTVAGITGDAIDEGLRSVPIGNWRTAVGSDPLLQKLFGLKRGPDTHKKVEERLKELSRWRNNWAHGGQDEVALTVREVREAASFLLLLGQSLDSAIAKRLLHQ